MKILLVSSKYMPEYSGSGLRAHNLYKRLSRSHNFSLMVVAGSVTENTVEEYEYDGFKVHRIAAKPHLSLSPNGLVRRIQLLKNFYSENTKARRFFRGLKPKPDLIHVFGQNNITSTAIKYANDEGIPLLIELCNEMPTPYQYVPFPFNLFISGRPVSDYRFICISERLKEVCLAAGVPDSKLWCRPNPVDEAKFHPVSRQMKNRIKHELTGFKDKDKLLVYVAKFIPRKNHLFLLDVLKELPDDYSLFLGGPVAENGPLKSEGSMIIQKIRDIVKNEGLEHRVRLKAGFIVDVDKYYQMADVYLFPTKEEGLGTPMLEALACGVPVVANRIKGITDSWICDGRNGFISGLQAPQFAEKTRLASSFPSERMEAEADRILNIAGTRSIDEKYWEIITTLVKH
jgi:glycosyltransferase involved in cell wall biosynthesis